MKTSDYLGMDTLDGRFVETHEDVPFLLVGESRQPGCTVIVFRELCQPTIWRKENKITAVSDRTTNRSYRDRISPLDILIIRLDRLRKLDVPRGILVPVVNDRIVRKRPEVRKRLVHLFRGAFEESATASLE